MFWIFCFCARTCEQRALYALLLVIVCALNSLVVVVVAAEAANHGCWRSATTPTRRLLVPKDMLVFRLCPGRRGEVGWAGSHTLTDEEPDVKRICLPKLRPGHLLSTACSRLVHAPCCRSPAIWHAHCSSTAPVQRGVRTGASCTKDCAAFILKDGVHPNVGK